MTTITHLKLNIRREKTKILEKEALLRAYKDEPLRKEWCERVKLNIEHCEDLIRHYKRLLK